MSSPFEDIRALLRQLPLPDEDARARTRRVFAAGTGSSLTLGLVEDAAVWLACWNGRAHEVRKPLVAMFAGTHGVASHGISAEAPEATAKLVELCAVGGAPVNGACLAYDIGLKVFDLALSVPTADFTKGPALDERDCAATMAFGMEAVAGGTDLLCVSALGVAEDVASGAILAALYGGTGHDWVERGARTDAAIVEQQAAVIDAGLALHRAHLGDPLEVLRRFGGREFAAIAGAIVAARMERVPVVLDGPATIAAASVLHHLSTEAIEHCLLAQQPPGARYAEVCGRLRLGRALNLDMTGGQGAAGAICVGFVKAAAQIASTLTEANRNTIAS